MKTVIQVFSTKYDSENGYHGIGDLLRSSLGMYNLSKQYNFNLIVDYSLHPIANFLRTITHKDTELVKTHKDKVIFLGGRGKILNYIKKTRSDIIIFFGWLGTEVYDTKMTTESTNFMKEILVPNEIFSKKLERKILKIPYKDYTIIHYRLGDDEMNNNNEMKYEHLLRHFMKNYEQTDILLSDCLNYKIYISKNVKIFTYKNKISHLGRNDNMNEIEHSLIELLILSRAKYIKSYTVYPWISGFTHMISYIYNIPLKSEINIKIP